MSKIRVYELAKELGMESKDVIRRLGKMGGDVKNHMSTVEDSHAEMLRDIMRPKIAVIAEEKQKTETVKQEEKPKAPQGEAEKTPPKKAEEQDTSVQKMEKATPISQKAEVKDVLKEKKQAETVVEKDSKPEEEKKVEKRPISTEVPVTDQPRQQGVFAKNPNQARQQGVFQKNNRQQGNFQNRNNNGDRQQGNFQNRNNNGDRQQGNFQNRNNGDRQQGNFQNRNNNGDRQQGNFQNRNNNGDRQQGNFQNRNNGDRQQGNFQNRNNGDRQQGNFQNRNNGDRPQGNFQNRNNGDRPQGNFQNRNNGDRPQGNFQNRNNGDRPQGNFQNRNNGDRPQGNFQNRNNGDRPQGGFQNRNNTGDRPQGGFQNRNNSGGSAPAERTFTTENKPQEKKEPRRFEQKKKNNHYESKKKEMDHRENMRHRPNPKQKRQKKEEMPPVVPKTVMIGESVVISELAKSMSKTAAELIKVLFGLGVMATLNQEIDADTAIILGEEFGITVEIKQDKTLEIMDDDVDDESTLEMRPPVVTVMGHVDHGKTSLLDAIRNTNVIAREAGGITQHIGAYQVEISGKKITFLDTPGHEAFTSMRARGAQVTDIAILVVAADDGVMPQTIEAINHAKAAKVPIIVAINKIDKPGANVDKIRQELTEYELVDEEWGGNTIMVPVSAKKEEGIENLLEMILLVSEVAELKSNPNRNARGTVIEAQLDKGRGAVATLLVQKGTLHVGDIIVAGAEFAKVRAMIDDKGRRCKIATPSMPVEILGFSNAPTAGEVFVGVDGDKDARYISDHNAQIKREKELGKSAKVSLDDLFKQISEGEVKDLNIVLKADVQGSVEALAQSIGNLSTDEVRVNIIHSGVGAIVETDVMLAEASDAIIIGFNVRPDVNTKKAAEKAGVEILMYRVIYEALDAIKAAMTGLLDPEFKEVVVGHVEVRDVIKVPKVGLIAGSYVLDGKVVRNGQIRLLRNGIVIHEGTISSLRRFKDDVKEVQTGYECGIGIENFNDIKVQDQMEIFIMEETKRAIE